MEKQGIPSVMLVTTAMASLARAIVTSMGMPGFPLIVIEHPVSGLDPATVRSRIPPVFQEIVKGLTQQPANVPPAAAASRPKTVVFEGSDLLAAARAMNDAFLARDWGDGLPLVPPTPERVEEMLAATRHSPDEVIGIAGPRKGIVTVRNIAINAVMAGARPEYMPVLIAMMKAALKPEFDLYRQCVTTNPVAPMVIVSGPITDVSQLNINSGVGAFGPGWQANATIGRTLRLLMINAGGAVPGSANKSTHGQFARYTAAWAVNRSANPFPSLQEQITNTYESVARYRQAAKVPWEQPEPIGPDDNVVILFPMLDRNNVNDNVSTTGAGVLNSVATAMLTAEVPRRDSSYGIIRGPVLVVFGPEHAQMLAKEGWTLQDIRLYLYNYARYPKWRYTPGHGGFKKEAEQEGRRWIAEAPDQAEVPIVETPEDIYVTVAGGPGKHSAVFIGGYAPLVMAKIED